MQTFQRDLAVVGLIGLMAFGFHYFTQMDRQMERRRAAPYSTFVPQKPRGYVITDVRHPYWQPRLAQYWNYDRN